MLALPACDGNDEAKLVAKRVSNEQALRLIRSCEVTRLLALHSGEVDLTLEDGRRVLVTRPDATALSKAAVNASLERGCDVAVGME
jgi:ribosomal protein S4E